MPGVKAHDIQSGSSTAISEPRIRMLRSIDASDSPASNRFMVLRASEAPARNTNVGAHRWVTQRTRNWKPELASQAYRERRHRKRAVQH